MSGPVLLDIRLADGSSGIHAVNEILRTFLTAFPQTLLTGAKPEPTFLIRRPYNPEEVKAVISQALFSPQIRFSEPEIKPKTHPGECHAPAAPLAHCSACCPSRC